MNNDKLVCSTSVGKVRVNIYRSEFTGQHRYTLVYGTTVLSSHDPFNDLDSALSDARQAAMGLVSVDRYGRGILAILSRPCGGKSAWERSVGL